MPAFIAESQAGLVSNDRKVACVRKRLQMKKMQLVMDLN